MQAQYREQRYTTRNFHGQKKQLLGQNAGQAAPAWKVNQQQARRANGVANGANASGSKILLSHLPQDVTVQEVTALFVKTVGQVEEAFIIHNSQGLSKGMAVVGFSREGDAYVARTKYNGKIIDGRKPIRIEIVKDEDRPTIFNAPVAPVKPNPPSLLERLGGLAPAKGVAGVPAQGKKQAHGVAKAAPAAAAPQLRAQAAGPKTLRQKKGPKRVKKVATRMTAEQLDAEMDAYKAKVDA